ncbi:TPA: hypothetical protein HA265_05635 [Candidatus Woesearchaeota archaeon]|nr:hypothetical protein [Candidatus Woesearchaeota archaeon]
MRGKRCQLVDVLVVVFILIAVGALVTFFITGVPTQTVDAPVMQFSADEGIFDGQLTLMSYNIHYGSGYTNAYIKDAEGDAVFRYLNDVADIIKDADIVTLQEADRSVRRSHFEDEVGYLARKAGFRYAIFSDNWNIRLLPFMDPIKFSRLRTGHAILSKFPIKHHATLLFTKPEDASFWHKWFFVWRTQQFADIKVGDRVLRVFNVHLESESKADRVDQAKQLSLFAAASDEPMVLMGDFNALMPEASKKDFSGEDYLDDATIATFREMSQELGLRELFPPQQYTKDESRYFTFPSREPDRRLDYVFYSQDIDIVSAKVLSDDKIKEASDHLPTRVDISFR